MAKVRKSIDIAVPPERVWDLVTNTLSAETGGTPFAYENEFELPAGGVGATASRVVSRYAEREADASLSRLKQLAEG
jgi:hypothetical protein